MKKFKQSQILETLELGISHNKIDSNGFFNHIESINGIGEKALSKRYRDLNHFMFYFKDHIKVGCTAISKQTALQIAKDILEVYGE